MIPDRLDRISASIGALMIVPFFPRDDDPQNPIKTAFIVATIDRLLSTAPNDEEAFARLDWLITTECQNATKWEGLPQLIGLYATRYKLPPGMADPGCTLTSADSETAYQERIAAETNRNLLEWKQEREQRLLAGDVEPEPEPIILPLKRIPGPVCGKCGKEIETGKFANVTEQVMCLECRRKLHELEQDLEHSKTPPLPAEELARRAAELELEVLQRVAKRPTNQ